MDKIGWLFGALLITLFANCKGPHPEQAKLDELDSIQGIIRDFQLSMDTVDSDDVYKLAEHVDSQWTTVLQVYKDSGDRQFWLHDAAYFGSINKALKRYTSNGKSLRERMDFTLHQMETLENSIRDQKLTPEEIEEYYNREIQEYANLHLAYNKYVYRAKLAIVRWDSLGTSYDSIANYIRKLP